MMAMQFYPSLFPIDSIKPVETRTTPRQIIKVTIVFNTVLDNKINWFLLDINSFFHSLYGRITIRS
jgi:hypothetical protein